MHPAHPADIVIERVLSGGGMLPVVSRENTPDVLGIVSIDSLARVIGRRAV